MNIVLSLLFFKNKKVADDLNIIHTLYTITPNLELLALPVAVQFTFSATQAKKEENKKKSLISLSVGTKNARLESAVLHAYYLFLFSVFA